MASLVVLTFSDGTIIRCADLGEAKEKAIANQDGNDKICVDIVPEEGGPMLSLEFDRTTQDWVSGN